MPDRLDPSTDRLDAARRLARRQFQHPLVSASLDLDPLRFAAGAARATEINSLLDQAQQRLHSQQLEHHDRVALEQDIGRVGSYLTVELAQWRALRRLLATTDEREGSAVGLSRTLTALGRRQVSALVLGRRADERGRECLRCGQLYTGRNGNRCEADGGELRPLHSLRSAMIRSAVLQDAEVIVLDDFDDRPEIAAFTGVGALLRY